MSKSRRTSRVRELLDEIAAVLRGMKAEVPESNSKLGGVLDDLLMKIEEAQNECAEGKASPKSLMLFVRMAADLIEIIGKIIQATLSYKICCLIAAVYRKRDANDYRKEHKIIQNNCWA